MSDPDQQHETEPLKAVDLPVTVGIGAALDMADDLDQEGSVTLEIRADDAPELADELRWQVDNEQRITEYVEDYDGE